MNGKERLISVKTLTDRHMEEFIRCPYQFYLRQKKKGQLESYTWKQVVQRIVRQIIEHYFQFPAQARSVSGILKLIDMYWIKQPSLFESKGHYYTVLAHVSNYLVQYLLEDCQADPPLMLFEKVKVTSKELALDLSITLQIVQGTGSSFVIKKFTLEEDEESFTSYKHIAVLFSQEAFGILPERIEIISLLSGKRKSWHPVSSDVAPALTYITVIRDLLEQPKNYEKAGQRSACVICPFKEGCGISAHTHVLN
ncbi:hypothetical protein AM501_11750 [Aneurinibacillus migulanus]|uniref:hypothetical protein n=1 Tax=Aneurinibacillus migulanus TaxID=47500 RepID=UPI0005BC625C|nr:hypothetical protein [Aneurinibacillus migulanus]KIV54578.1 hypothetical protein TS64_16300 [Aneurinibacillus migulanus]KPD08025.1 hypothetical protein AM501_11750 [Aneurinibacillus migulanus]CEH30181.1 Uncharacterized protein BN1090_A2_02621 [Aneurinibacillus migulanus]